MSAKTTKYSKISIVMEGIERQQNQAEDKLIDFGEKLESNQKVCFYEK